MKKIYVLIAVIVFLIILSLGMYFYFKNSHACAKKGCYCKAADSEISCNDCSIMQPIFITGIFNMVKICSAKEVIICENSNNKGIKYDVDYSTCKNKLFLLNIPLS